MENEILPLKELVPFELFQQIFEKMMENEKLRMEEERGSRKELWGEGNR